MSVSTCAEDPARKRFIGIPTELRHKVYQYIFKRFLTEPEEIEIGYDPEQDRFIEAVAYWRNRKRFDSMARLLETLGTMSKVMRQDVRNAFYSLVTGIG